MAAMDPDHIQALAARCLVDPEFLPTALRHRDAGASDPHRPAPATSAAGSTDAGESAACAASRLFGKDELARVALFRAFIVKVKHNPVRNALPLTFRLLALLGEELAFFRSYASSFLAHRSGGPLPLELQTQLATEHLRQFLEPGERLAAAAVGDVLDHELTLADFRRSPLPQANQARDDAIRWRGRLEAKRYGTDVMHACAALAARNADPARDLRRRELCLAYWRPVDSDVVEVFEVDELTAFLFSMVDGGRTLADIAGQLAALELEQITLSDLRAFFGELAARGLIEQRGEDPEAAAIDRNVPCA
jgi:hypothetical protein